MNCPGLMSPVTPSKPLGLCMGCALYQFAADGIKPAARRAGGNRWQCETRVSLTAETPSLARVGTETGAGLSLGEA